MQTDYLLLADQLSVYVVKLLDKIRGHDELQVLLNKTGSNSEQETYELLARLKLAIRYREKKVSQLVAALILAAGRRRSVSCFLNANCREKVS